jgi:hypothetical protein
MIYSAPPERRRPSLHAPLELLLALLGPPVRRRDEVRADIEAARRRSRPRG